MDSHEKVEIAKLIRQPKVACKTEADFRAMKEKLMGSFSEEVIDKAVAGLCKEDDFILLSKLTGRLSDVASLGHQGVKLGGDTLPPDVFAAFHAPGDNDRLVSGLFEVKTTAKDTMKIGGNYLQRRRNFSNRLGQPLLFAVRFEKWDTWVFAPDDGRSKSVKVRFGDGTEKRDLSAG